MGGISSIVTKAVYKSRKVVKDCYSMRVSLFFPGLLASLPAELSYHNLLL